MPAVPPHRTDTKESTWRGPRNATRLPSERDALREAHAWVDPDGDPDTKDAYTFVHHHVTADGTVGAANVRACISAIGVLNGARGGADVPDADRRKVWEHLAAHLRDAGREPTELKG
jgi:uncharacterized protein